MISPAVSSEVTRIVHRGAVRRLWLLLAVHARRRWRPAVPGSGGMGWGVVWEPGNSEGAGLWEGSVSYVGGCLERTGQVGSLVWLN